MRLKRLFLWIMLSAGIANIGAANYTPENVSISLKVPGNDARHYSLTLQKQQTPATWVNTFSPTIGLLAGMTMPE